MRWLQKSAEGQNVLGEIIRESDAIAARRRRKEQIASAPKKAQPDPSAAAPSHWEACPGCQGKFDPAKDELMACSGCGEDRSTACCLKDPTQPCADCQALKPELGEEDAFAAPPSSALFDGRFRGKDGQESSATDEEEDQ